MARCWCRLTTKYSTNFPSPTQVRAPPRGACEKRSARSMGPMNSRYRCSPTAPTLVCRFRQLCQVVRAHPTHFDPTTSPLLFCAPTHDARGHAVHRACIKAAIARLHAEALLAAHGQSAEFAAVEAGNDSDDSDDGDDVEPQSEEAALVAEVQAAAADNDDERLAAAIAALAALHAPAMAEDSAPPADGPAGASGDVEGVEDTTGLEDAGDVPEGVAAVDGVTEPEQQQRDDQDATPAVERNGGAVGGDEGQTAGQEEDGDSGPNTTVTQFAAF